MVDDIAVVKSMVTDQFNHAPAQIFLNTGSPFIGRPSMGAWLTYGLGSESQNLPGFVVLLSGPNGPDGGTSLWGSGFLPSIYQGVQFRSQGDPVLYVSNPPGMDAAARRRSLDALKDLNRMQLAEIGDPETLTRIEQYEMAYRMQIVRARADGYRAASRSRFTICTAPSRARSRSRTIACWPGGSSSGACDSCSFIIGVGTATARAPATTS